MNKEILITINGTDNKFISIPLEELSHTIIFGDTGSGKSNLLHMLITNLTKTYSTDELKLALIDPKYVEFNSYKSLPHLLNSLAKSAKEINTLLDNCLTKLDNSNTPIIILIDELVELVFNNDVMSKITSILNNDSNSKIYLIMATQRPNAIPEEIIRKTNTQIYFPVNYNNLPISLSEEIKSTPLENYGEMIFINGTKKEFMQTAYITETKIKEDIYNCKK